METLSLPEASLFPNLIAAASAAFAYWHMQMVDYTLALPLIVSSSPAGALSLELIHPSFFTPQGACDVGTLQV